MGTSQRICFTFSEHNVFFGNDLFSLQEPTSVCRINLSVWEPIICIFSFYSILFYSIGEYRQVWFSKGSGSLNQHVKRLKDVIPCAGVQRSDERFVTVNGAPSCYIQNTDPNPERVRCKGYLPKARRWRCASTKDGTVKRGS